MDFFIQFCLTFIRRFKKAIDLIHCDPDERRMRVLNLIKLEPRELERSGLTEEELFAPV